MKTIGVIGVGLMGMGVAKRLLERGFQVRVRDIRPEAEEEARAAGAEVCASPAELARGCDAVITLVVDAAQTEDVVFCADGAAAAMRQHLTEILRAMPRVEAENRDLFE